MNDIKHSRPVKRKKVLAVAFFLLVLSLGSCKKDEPDAIFRHAVNQFIDGLFGSFKPAGDKISSQHALTYIKCNDHIYPFPQYSSIRNRLA